MLAINTERNVRINLTLPKKMYNKIQLLAKEDMRSANSLIVFLASQTLNQPEWKEKTQQLIDSGLLEE